MESPSGFGLAGFFFGTFLGSEAERTSVASFFAKILSQCKNKMWRHEITQQPDPRGIFLKILGAGNTLIF
jgi:hypothetical protein